MFLQIMLYNKVMATPISPNTDVFLLKCPLEMDNNHQLNFANATAQYNYFHSLPKIECENFSYQRKDGIIRVNEHIDDIISYNYVMYRNDNYSQKWFYAFITNMQYVNDKCTYITIKTDTWQTWQFDLTFKKCFVEREHVNDDTIGAHTIPEMIEYGHFVCDSVYDYTYASPNDNSVVCCFQVTTTTLTNSFSFPNSTYSMFNGIPQGCSIFGFDLNKENTSKLFFVCGAYDGAGKGDAIVNITLVPKACCTWESKPDSNNTNWLVPVGSTSSVSFSLIPAQTSPATIDGYTPKNNKLFTSPYNYLYVTNNNGADVTYRYEDFTNRTPNFTLFGSFEQGGALYMMPLNSKISIPRSSVTGDCFNEGIPATKLPNLSWKSDYYLNWQAVNGKAVEIQMGLDAISWLGSGLGALSAGSGGDYQHAQGGSPMGLANSVLNTAQQIRQAKMTPPQAKGNLAAGSFAFSDGQCKFTFRKMTIKQEYAKVVDDYLSAYGYKVNSYKIPNITGRTNWNYVKTLDVNIVGDIPQEDMNEIKGFFDRGITIWHNPSTYLDYTQSNNITS